MKTALESLPAHDLVAVCDRLEDVFDHIVASNVAHDDLRGEDDITKTIVRYFRDTEPVIRFVAPGGDAGVVRFIEYKQKGGQERERGDLGLLFDVRRARGAGHDDFQGVAFVEAKLQEKAGKAYTFKTDQVERMTALVGCGFVSFYSDERNQCNPYAVRGTASSRARLAPAGVFTRRLARSLRLPEVHANDSVALSSQFTFRWLQGFDLDMRPDAVRKFLDAGVGSYIHAKVALAPTYERALDLARGIPNFEIPGHILDVGSRALEIASEFDRNDRGPDLDRGRGMGR